MSGGVSGLSGGQILILRIFLSACLGFLFCTSVFAFTANDKVIGYSGKMNCSGPDAPLIIDLWIFYDEGKPTGYMRLGWWKHNVQYKEDVNVPIDVVENAAEDFDLSISKIPVNERLGVSGEISYAGTNVFVALSHADWNCDQASLKRRQNFPTISAAAVRDLRRRYTEDQLANGPSRGEVREQMTAAAAYRLCNPQRIEDAIAQEALESTGVIDYSAVKNQCIASMFGVPIGILIFDLTDWGCEVGPQDGTAQCNGVMSLRCDTPTDISDISGGICSAGTMDYADFFGDGQFLYNKDAGKWTASSIEITAKER